MNSERPEFLSDDYSFLMRIPKQIHQQLIHFSDNNPNLLRNAYYELGEFVYDLDTHKSYIELNLNNRVYKLDCMLIEPFNSEERSQQQMVAREDLTIGCNSNERMKILTHLDYEILTIPKNYKLTQEQMNAFQPVENIRQDKLKDHGGVNIIQQKTAAINLNGNPSWSIDKNEQIKSTPAACTSSFKGNKRAYRKTLSADNLCVELIELFKTNKELSFKSVCQLLDNPELPLKKALDKVCDYDPYTNMYRLKEILQQ